MKRLITTALLSTAVLLGGCATSKDMAFRHLTDKVTTSSKPIFLMSVNITNSYRTRFQPDLKFVFVDYADSTGKASSMRFEMDS